MGHSEAEKISVLFVCMGNICRSPTADAVFRHHVRSARLEHLIHIDSAGTHAYHIGEPPDRRSQQAALKRGYNLQSLRARRVVEEDFSHFQYVLAMDHYNLEELRQNCPSQYTDRLGLLLQYSDQWKTQQEVPDPYYGGNYGFERVLDLVENASQGLLRHISENIYTR
ncbi:low molecular weight phosphotyrosine protein phosphatase [Nitrosomonas sp. HPC101]|uniref:low molecular weight protein-tyrosine-phosphatase n=1 Tax=Nitrosomonas sp. HPC101 TaxID=1658667 RepID=UPI0013699D73|nr:low molecular weight protein-tyrosine-phosphatase [Nitrosomonas sp. HPC101]MXS84691.1 low molecular weight phosphotyrosine protein phosphatase [Nitrosomonas sp. HPC101]